MAVSKALPSLGTWAGARFTIRRLFGHLKPELTTADLTRSLDS